SQYTLTRLLQALPTTPITVTDPPTTELYTLSLHDALPISHARLQRLPAPEAGAVLDVDAVGARVLRDHEQLLHARLHQVLRLLRSEEHTSELQSRFDLVCRLLLEKKK